MLTESRGIAKLYTPSEPARGVIDASFPSNENRYDVATFFSAVVVEELSVDPQPTTPPTPSTTATSRLRTLAKERIAAN